MDRRGLAVATIVIMFGTLTTSVLGFLRAFVVARYFGAHTGTDAFFAALVVPQMFYNPLIGGAITAVLIPAFSRLASDHEGDLWLIVRTVVVLEIALSLVTIGILELLAHPLMIAIASGFQLRVHAGALPLSVQLLRVLLPTLLFSALSAIALATLYSLGRRATASFAPSFFHLGIIAAAVLGAARFGITVLAVGAVIGAAVQFAVQIPALMAARRTSRVRRPQPLVDFHHPALRHIIRLYIPVAGGLLISVAGQVADINFKSHLPQNGGLSSMQFATQVAQFPIGIVAAALAFAILPAISRQADAGGSDSPGGFTDTLALGFRMSLVLMVPAMVLVLLLATPITALLYQRGQFTPLDTVYTARALIGYAPQLPFVGIDQLLIYAFYARHNTVVPVLVGVVGVVAYVALAFVLAPFTIMGLALANTISIVVHTLVLLVLVLRAIGGMRGRRLPQTILKVGAAGLAMAAAAGIANSYVSPAGASIIARFGDVLIPGGIALLVYVAALVLLRVDEARILFDMVQRRMAGGTTSQ